jgi:hypothetical protein
VAIDIDRATKNVLDSLQSIGIDREVSGKDSHTAVLVRMIITAVLQEVKLAEVQLKSVPIQTTLGPGSITDGKANIV